MHSLLRNRKGFSLVELMIVVVIMGILIAVAIPLYNAITHNANNKTCGSNIKTIKTNATNYIANYNEHVSGLAQLEDMFDDGQLPECPLSRDGDHTNDYTIAVRENGGALVYCKNYSVAEKHTPNGSESSAPTTGIIN